MELAIVILVCVFGTGTLFGVSIIIFGERFKDQKAEAPQIYKPAPQHTIIPQSNLEAFFRNPVLTVRHKQIKSRPKVKLGKGVNALIRESDESPTVPGKLYRGTAWESKSGNA